MTIDTTPPDAPTITTTTTTTNVTTPTIEGTAEAGSTVELFNGDTSLGTVTAGSDESFSITSSQLAEGIYSLTVKATDEAGNESTASNELAITIDTTAPSTPSITTTTDLTNNPTPTIEGTAEAGSTVELFNGDTSLGTVTAGSDGSFSITSSQLADGNYNLTVKSTDAAGNPSSASTAFALTIDTTAPNQPTIDAPSDTTFTINNPTITGTAEAESTVALLIGTAVIGTQPAGSDGSFAITSSPLFDNVYELTVTATDAAGNTSSASAGLDITIATGANDAPLLTTTDFLC